MTETVARRREFGISQGQWTVLGIGLAAVLVMFQRTILYIFANWEREEYSHGYLIPVISLLLLWQRRRQFQQMPFSPSWAGVLLMTFGVGLYFISAFAAITTLDAYAFVIVIAGAFLAVTGWSAFRVALPALALLLLMVPIPAFFFNNLSSSLQLVSSQIGVAVIRMFGISVFLEGNVIDLGSYKLQVVEACSGLRYLFPLLTLGVILVSLVRFPLWIRLLIVVSTIPITVLMNSFRIGVIGVLVEHYGIEQAEGFLHDFEGWIIFMACLLLLVLEIWVVVRLTGDKRGLRDIIAIEWPESRPTGVSVSLRPLAVTSLAAVATAMVAAAAAVTLPSRPELVPERVDFTRFPLQSGEWQGRRGRLEGAVLEELKLDDYLMADYVDSAAAAPVNFYVAYYASQRSGRSAHSPASCLPGGGWRMSELAQHVVEGVRQGDHQLRVNRVLIEQGNNRQLVYYWFKQRQRNVTNEYLVKWYLLWDSLLQSRSDGALVRLVTPLTNGERTDAGDERLATFARQFVPILEPFVPD
jgi:exosortase D (VPLPA-CTERM-specific)